MSPQCVPLDSTWPSGRTFTSAARLSSSCSEGIDDLLSVAGGFKHRIVNISAQACKHRSTILEWGLSGVSHSKAPQGWPAFGASCYPNADIVLGGGAAAAIYPEFIAKNALAKSVKRIAGKHAGDLIPATTDLSNRAACQSFFADSNHREVAWMIKPTNGVGGEGIHRVEPWQFEALLALPHGKCTASRNAGILIQAAISPHLIEGGVMCVTTPDRPPTDNQQVARTAPAQ